MQCGDSESVESVESVEVVVAPGRGRRGKKGSRNPSMMYTRGGSGGQQCPGSLDDCVSLCPSEVTLVTKII